MDIRVAVSKKLASSGGLGGHEVGGISASALVSTGEQEPSAHEDRALGSNPIIGRCKWFAVENRDSGVHKSPPNTLRGKDHITLRHVPASTGPSRFRPSANPALYVQSSIVEVRHAPPRSNLTHWPHNICEPIIA